MWVSLGGPKFDEIRLADIRLRRVLIVHLITDESNNHAVKVEEEHDKVEAELAERFLGSVRQLYHFLPLSTVKQYIPSCGRSTS